MSSKVQALHAPHREPATVFAALADAPGAAWLDGGATSWSVMVWSPDEVVTAAADWPVAARALSRVEPGPRELPFVGGVLGYVGYEAASATIPSAPGRATPEPPVHLGRYAGALLHHGPTGRWLAVGDERVRREAAALLTRPPTPRPPPIPRRPVVREGTQAAWIAAVRRVQELLLDGDAYQINLTRVVHVADPVPAWEAWLTLRGTTAPERGAWLTTTGGVQIASASPERLLDVDGRHAVTTPIKGTRPRGATPAEDATHAAALATSEKERAELVMIVDLCRNDLGRVAVPGSVVASPRTLAPTPYCHHASAVVSATLAPARDAWDALAALFPPGSVTGAPKLRAVQRIAELEPEPRGVYCGAVGYVSDHGRAAWSVAIRTAVWADGAARYHVGGGIVVDSDPAAEWEETLVKGARLREALTGAGQ